MSTDTLPNDHIKVEIAFATADPDDPAPTWTDITQWVDLVGGVSVTFGRGDEYANVQTGSARVSLVNTDGRFTPGNVSSPYYPNVKIRKRLRVSYTNPTGGATAYRFSGYVEEWPTEWPTGGDSYSSSQVTAVDRFKRLGANAPLRSIVEEQYLVDDPTAYYLLNETAGSTMAGDTSGNARDPLKVTQVGAGGALTFAANTGPGTDNLTAPDFAPVNVTNGKYLAVTTGVLLGSAARVSVTAFINTSAAANQTVVRLYSSAGQWVEIGTTAAGKATASNFDTATGATTFTLTSAASINDGETHELGLFVDYYLAVDFTYDVRADLVIDGVSVANTTYVVIGPYSWDTMTVGGHSAGALFTGTIAHVATYADSLDSGQLLQQTLAGTTAFADESSDARIFRLGTYAGIDSSEMSLETGLSRSIAAVDTFGLAPLVAMQDVTDTEDGVLFIDGQGILTFQARSHRYNAASVFTVTAADIDTSARFIVNDALLINDATVTRDGGITARAVNAESVANYGTTAINVTLLTTSDLEVVDAANWKANQTAAIDPRLPNLSIDLMTSPLLTATALTLTIGSRITLSGLPAQAPAAIVDLFVEGWTETISSTGWVLAMNTSPTSTTSTAWVLDSLTYSQLDVSTRLAY